MVLSLLVFGNGEWGMGKKASGFARIAIGHLLLGGGVGSFYGKYLD